MTDPIERAKALNEKKGLSAIEYAFTIATALHIGARTMRQMQRSQMKADPAWTEIDAKPEDIDRFADYAEQLIEVLGDAIDRADAKVRADGEAVQ